MKVILITIKRLQTKQMKTKVLNQKRIYHLLHWQEWKDGTIDKDGKRKWKYYFMKYGLLPRNPKRINKYMTPEEKERLREENKKRRKEIYKKVAALCKSEELQNIRTV
jgi:Lhr-like helicase